MMHKHLSTVIQHSKIFWTNSNPRKKTIIIVGFCILIMLIGSRVFSAIALKHSTATLAIPVVDTITATSSNHSEEIILPGNIQAWYAANVYARTNGYIKKWYVDIGYFVKKNDLLAEIEAPDLDAQLRQTEANLEAMIAKNRLAQSTAKRWLQLRKTDSVSKQATDEKVDN